MVSLSRVLLADSRRLRFCPGFSKLSEFGAGQAALLEGDLAGRGVCMCVCCGGRGMCARLEEDSLGPPGRAKAGATGHPNRSWGGQRHDRGKVGGLGEERARN